MPPFDNHPADRPTRHFLRLRRTAANALALIIILAAAYAASKRSVEDLTLVFRNAPLHIVPEGHNVQVGVVRSYVPKGANLFYFMDKSEAWQLGLWQRSLYPDYVMIPIPEDAGVTDSTIDVLRARYHIRFALATGPPPPKLFAWRISLPNYPNGIPLTFGEIQD